MTCRASNPLNVSIAFAIDITITFGCVQSKFQQHFRYFPFEELFSVGYEGLEPPIFWM
jgi:hypothetical protein